MKLGAVFPQTEIGNDPAVIRRFAQTVESMGYDCLAVYDHVMGVDADRPGWSGAYSLKDQFHEIFVLFGYLAACTERLELVSRVLVLPQRQAGLVAKQAAEIAVLSGGRLRLGLGVGWNSIEMESLGESFGDRGRRFEEQVQVLRALWSTENVTFHGEYHHIDRAGIAPRPNGGHIPVWIGGRADVVLKRAARIADGFMPQQMVAADIAAFMDRIEDLLAEAGRESSSFGVDASVKILQGGLDDAIELGQAWYDAGAGYLTVNTLGTGLLNVDDHLASLAAFRDAWPG
ncbi:MAG: LLM class F420-dependent oxidoreductase [Chloroflexota bacterium]